MTQHDCARIRHRRAGECGTRVQSGVAVMKKHRHEIAYPLLWNAVAGALKSAQDAHPEFVIPTPASITKRVVGSLLAPEVRAALAVETGGDSCVDIAPNGSDMLHPVQGRGDPSSPPADPLRPENWGNK